MTLVWFVEIKFENELRLFDLDLFFDLFVKKINMKYGLVFLFFFST